MTDEDSPWYICVCETNVAFHHTAVCRLWNGDMTEREAEIEAEEDRS